MEVSMKLEEALVLVDIIQQIYGADTLGEMQVILKLHWKEIQEKLKERL